MEGLTGFVLQKDHSGHKGDNGPEEGETEAGRQQLGGKDLKSTAFHM